MALEQLWLPWKYPTTAKQNEVYPVVYTIYIHIYIFLFTVQKYIDFYVGSTEKLGVIVENDRRYVGFR